MRLEKVENRNRGYDIYLIIANRDYKSWWTSPPKSVDHAGLEYLKDRYPKINTKARMETFKELYKNLWIDITKTQRQNMKHCIGLDYKKKPYRNYYCTSHKDENWNNLVEKGLAVKSSKEPNSYGCTCFWLSKQGVEFILDKSISDKVYEEL
ncbi:hypothetical protein [Clostridium botulinum]|uniref:hypothetical protein n=1 Tax=Clostridium botulinum TaxID=1491 RepID=UPI0006AC6BCE|nr:hypothetical protein [Clostridium botulinum]AWB17241.1 hypothetical protein DB732_07125 [Clostridium botulinum]AWB30033.1 hypothetical protein DBN47_07105 [Clostridium botulinum]EGT5616400.1 hypothetical protein [Clostridium botulinum]EGT5623153.1 hypothetical protein [Clostridium botulinum]EGT5626291.1 hypothetical protein [Clostridium botulinum]